MKEVIKKLDFYSKRFAKVLFRAFPEWERYLSLEPARDNPEGGSLVVKVPVPEKGLRSIPAEEDYLRIDSNGEIIVSFDSYHDHFDLFGTEAENFRQAVEFIRSIVKEEICVVGAFNENKWRGAASLKAGEKPDLSKFSNLDPPCREVYVRSWRGTYNRKYDLAEDLEDARF